MKCAGRVYRETFIDIHGKVAFVKLYDRKPPITAADLLNDRVMRFFNEHEYPCIAAREIEFCDA